MNSKIQKLEDDNKMMIQFGTENENLKKENHVLRQENENLKGRMNKIEKEIEEMKSNKAMTDSSNVMEMFQSTIQMLKDEAKQDRQTLKEEIQNAVAEQMQEMMTIKSKIEKEVKEELKEESLSKEKQNNLVMYNIPESNGEGKEKNQEEFDKVAEVIRTGCKVEKFHISQIIRLNKREDVDDDGTGEKKDRPVLVTLDTPSKKWEIMRNAKNMKDAPQHIKKIGISPDLTLKQRQRDRVLREQLKEKRDAKEKGWYISKGELKRGEERFPYFSR